MPQVEDMNGDGFQDIVVSEYMCNIAYFEGNGTDNYSERKQFKLEDGTDLTYFEKGNYSDQMNNGRTYGAVHLHDWNEDGLLDILFMASHIPLTVHINCGTAEEPVFKAGEKVLLNGEEILLRRPSVQVADINLDGTKDLIFGLSFKAAYAVNSGTNSEPQFDLLEYFYAGDSVQIEMIESTREARPIHGEVHTQVCDWNSDGYPDLLIGENCGWSLSPPWEMLYLFMGIPDGSVGAKSSPQVPLNRSGITVRNRTVHYNLSNYRNPTLSIFSLKGRKIMELKTSNRIGTVNLSNLADGSYIIRLNTDSEIFSQKITLF